MNKVARTREKTHQQHHPAAQEWPAEVAPEVINRLNEIDGSRELVMLRRDFAEVGIRVELLPAELAPRKLRKSRPQAWVDTDARKALCISVPKADTKVSDVIYVGAEALAVAHEFPRQPGNAHHEALVNSFALSYVTTCCGPRQAVASFKVQLRKAQRVRLQGALDEELRNRIALRCWAISTAIDDEEDERVLMRQLEIVDAETSKMVKAIRQHWGLRSPASGVAAQKLLDSGDPLARD